MPRQLFEIAAEIKKEWKPINYGALPYVDAMGCLKSINDNYGCDSAHSVVCYFLANAGTWRGDVAKRIKSELKLMAGIK